MNHPNIDSTVTNIYLRISVEPCHEEITRICYTLVEFGLPYGFHFRPFSRLDFNFDFLKALIQGNMIYDMYVTYSMFYEMSTIYVEPSLR